MTQTNSFLAELVRDANRLENLDDFKKRRILEQAVTTIRDMRETIGIPSSPGRDSVVDIHTVALSIEHGWRSDDDVRNALLHANVPNRGFDLSENASRAVHVFQLTWGRISKFGTRQLRSQRGRLEHRSHPPERVSLSTISFVVEGADDGVSVWQLRPSTVSASTA